jgi:hypothetical protein
MRTKQSKEALRQWQQPVEVYSCQQDHHGDGPDGPDSVALGGSMGDDFIDADDRLEPLLARLTELEEDVCVWAKGPGCPHRGHTKLVAVVLDDGQSIKLDPIRLVAERVRRKPARKG